MTEQEAIKDIKRQIWEIDSEDADITISTKSLVMAIKALEKQIPKRLKHDVCPICGTDNDKIIKHLGNPQAHKVVYCWNCGQKLDWSDEDDNH